MVNLLPDDFDERLAGAVKAFWTARGAACAEKSQGGTRDAVINGKNMDGFVGLVRAVALHCGLPATSIFTDKGRVVLPGYYRATKNWDLLVVHRKRLVAVFEFKSQVGSFGNNFNNRSEEVIGSAADLWVAHEHGAFNAERILEEPQAVLLAAEERPPSRASDPRPPFLAWLMLLEECAGSTSPVRADEPHYRVFPEFRGASYAQRYHLLCERLMERQLYSAAALVLSSREQGSATGEHRGLSEATSIRNLFVEFAARAVAAAEVTGRQA